MLPHVFSWAQCEPALGGVYGRIGKAAAGDEYGTVGIYKVSVSGVDVRLLTSVRQYICSILY